MARYRRTLVLILVCLPILATVITAFRVNLPKSSQEKPDAKKQQHSDVHEHNFGKLSSVKIESAKRSYDDLKKSVREKITETRPSYKIIDLSDDSDDSDDAIRISQNRLKRQEPVKVIGKTDTKLKGGKNDEENDVDDNEFIATGRQLKTFSLKKKTIERKENIKVQLHDKSKLTYGGDVKSDEDKDDDNDNNRNDDDDDDNDSDDDDDDDDDDNDDDDDDNDNDDDDDDGDVDDEETNGFFKMILQTFTKVTGIQETDETNDGDFKKPVEKDFVTEEDDDDNYDNDDDDDDDDVVDKIKSEINKQKALKPVTNILRPTETKSIVNKPEIKRETKITQIKQNKDSSVRKLNEQEKTKVELKSEVDKGKKTERKDPATVTVKFLDKKETPIKRQDELNKLQTKSNSEFKKKEEKSISDSKKIEEKRPTHESKKREEKAVTDFKKNTERKSTSEVKVKEEKQTISSKKNEEKKTVSEQKTTEDRKLKDTPKEMTKESLKSSDSKKDSKAELIKKHSEKAVKQHKTSVEMLMDSQETETKHESHLEHVTDALKRRHLLQSEFEDFYTFFPTFAPNFSRIHNPECRRHGQIFLRQLRGSKLWALNMVDATAKIPSGILQGNGIQLGNFDQCLGSRARVQLETGSVVQVQGKYCLARLDLKAEYPELEVPVHLAQAKNLIKSRIDDPGHFVPRFSTLSWGVCVPAACDPQDVEVVVKDAVLHYQRVSGLVIRVKVDPDDCHTAGTTDWWEDWLELPTVLTLSFYAAIILLVLVATIQDIATGRKPEENAVAGEAYEKKERNKKTAQDNEKDVAATKRSDGFLSSFSLCRTISKLVAPGTDDEIPCIHGVRGIATIALLISHKFLPVAVTPYTNRLNITETVISPLWSWCRAGWMYTDCFLLLSGALTAHRILVDSDTAAPKRLLSRYLRLTPALLAVIVFYAYIWDNISTGPMWGTLVTKNSKICQEGWWWNLLYVQNYFGFEEMCAPQTHQLALDMQLTIFGCLITWAMQVNPGLSKLLLPSIHIWAAYSRYTTVRDHRLTMLVYHGVSVSQLYRTARLSYTSALHRSTAYLIGLSLGMALQKSSQMHKLLHILGWMFSGALWGLVWWAGFDSGSTQYRYNVTFAAPYAAFAPIASAIAIAWVIYAVHCGHCEFLSRFLCCRFLVFISRFSYALYLCQFIVFFTNAATVRSSSEFTLMSLIDAQEISAIVISSVILTLTLVIPLQSLPKNISFTTSTDNKEIADAHIPEGLKNEQNEVNKERVERISQIKSRQPFVAHREVLEEIPEVEFEYETQRDKLQGLEEIMEEEEDDNAEEEMQNNSDNEELEIIEEEQGGEEEYWADREEYEPRRLYSEEDRDLDEWEWTAHENSQNGAQYYQYSR